jgi:hypothetical protein
MENDRIRIATGIIRLKMWKLNIMLCRTYTRKKHLLRNPAAKSKNEFMKGSVEMIKYFITHGCDNRDHFCACKTKIEKEYPVFRIEKIMLDDVKQLTKI